MASTHDVHRASTIELTVNASPAHVAALRDWLANWLDAQLAVDAERRADIVLATYEALSNCADHAYRGHFNPGEVTIKVGHDDDAAVLTVCVLDRGVWIESTPEASRFRGRGIALMRMLARTVTVDGRGDGTTVCLHFDHCPAAARPR